MKKTKPAHTSARGNAITRRSLLKTLAATVGITLATGLPRVSPGAGKGGVEARFYKRGDHLAG